MTIRDFMPLVPIFEALYAEKSTSRAAQRLGVTQSAVSQSLARMRLIVDDELFETSNQGMRPTPRAMQMAARLLLVMENMRAALAPEHFDAVAMQRSFNISFAGGFDAVALPLLVPEINRRAPGIGLRVNHHRSSDLIDDLTLGETELAFDFVDADGDIRSELLTSVPARAIARKGHPEIGSTLSRGDFAQLPHVALFASGRRNSSDVMTREKERLGVAVNVAMTVSSLATMGAVVECTNLIGIVGAIAAKELEHRYDINVFAVPSTIVDAKYYQLWHIRYDHDPAHLWLRDLVKEVAAATMSRVGL